MPILLDTHVWIWWVTEDRRLSRRAVQTIRRATRTDGVTISAISIWEVAKKVEKNQLVLDRPVRDWVGTATAREFGHSGADAGDPDRELQPAAALPWRSRRPDIVATARHLQAVLITRDRRVRTYPHVQSIW